MRLRVKPFRSDTIGALAKALAEAQGEMETARRDSTNPFFKSSYADLASIKAACQGALSSHGLSVWQGVTADGARVSVETMLMHESGEWVSSTLTMSAKEDAPQPIGSVITYARRYALAAAVGVAPGDDDDAEAAMGRSSQPARSAAKGPSAETVLEVKESESKPGDFWVKTNGGVYLTQDAVTADQIDQARRDKVDIVITGKKKKAGAATVTMIEKVSEVVV